MLAALVLAAALQFGASDLQPRTYTSPSEAWELFVDPSDRSGAGPARCRSSREGVEAWSAELPFTLQAAVMDDRGVAAGYAFTEGHSSEGELLVVILSETGQPVFEERTRQRDDSSCYSFSADPNVLGLLLQPQLGRIVLRVDDVETDGGLESWWSYDLHLRALHSRVQPTTSIEDLEEDVWSLAAQAVPGTPLILSQWYQGEDARFVLLDQDLQDVWSLVFPEDYAEVDGEDPYYEMRDAGGAILSTEEGRFDLRSYAEGTRVTFAVERDADAPDGWRVTEVARVPYAPEAATAALAEIEDLELRLLSAVALDTGASERPFVRDVLEFDVAPSGEIRFLRDEGGAITQVRLGPDDRLLEELPLDPRPLGAEGRTVWAALPGEAWLLAVSPWGFDLPAVLWRFDGRTGQARQLPAEGLGSVEELATFEGGIVAANSWLESNYPWETLVGLDPEGRTIWSVNAEEQSQTLSIDGLAVDESGRCAVVASVFNDLRIFGPGGVPEAVLDLEELLPTPPNYPGGLRTDLDGGWLLYDFGGTPPLWRLAADGAVLGSLTPRSADGREDPDLARALRREGDRRLWTSDGVALYQLDDEGAVVRTVGAAPDAAALTEAARVQVDRLGRVLVQDRRTCAIHLFDRTGARVGLATYPEEHRGPIYGGGDLSIARDDGRFLVRAGATTLEYAPDGALIGETTLALRQPCFQPGLGSAWGFGDEGLVRVAADGRVLRSIQRFPDGQWLSGGSIAVGPDGALVVCGGVRGEEFHRLVSYDADGEHRRTLRIPLEVRGTPIVHGDLVVLQFFGPAVHVVDLEQGTVRRVSVDRPGEEEANWSYGISPDGRELWAASWKTLTLYRFELPTG